MFNKMNYENYIKYLEGNIQWIYIIVMTISALMGIITGFITLLITLPIGYLISNQWTIHLKIKIEQMKWEIDVHKKLMEE